MMSDSKEHRHFYFQAGHFFQPNNTCKNALCINYSFLPIFIIGIFFIFNMISITFFFHLAYILIIDISKEQFKRIVMQKL